MELKIISLKKIEFEGTVSSVNLKTMSGEITVLDHHRPLITSLMPGEAVIVKKDGSKFNFAVNSGFMEIGPNNEVAILADGK